MRRDCACRVALRCLVGRMVGASPVIIFRECRIFVQTGTTGVRRDASEFRTRPRHIRAQRIRFLTVQWTLKPARCLIDMHSTTGHKIPTFNELFTPSPLVNRALCFLVKNKWSRVNPPRGIYLWIQFSAKSNLKQNTISYRDIKMCDIKNGCKIIKLY